MATGSLQIKGGIYYAVLSYKDDFGHRKQKWINTKLPERGNKRKAEELMETFNKEFEDGSLKKEVQTSSSNILFSDFLTKWLEIMKSSLEVTMYSSYLQIIERAKVYFGKRGIFLEELQPIHIQDFYQMLLGEGLSGDSVIHYHASIRKALQYAVKMGMIPSNPADRVERPKKGVFIGACYNKDELGSLLKL